MLPPSVANVIKLGPDNISGERIIYTTYQITDCSSRSGNCLLYGTQCGDLTRTFPPANLLFVQSPSACFNKSSYASSSQSKYEVVLFVHLNFQELTNVQP